MSRRLAEPTPPAHRRSRIGAMRERLAGVLHALADRIAPEPEASAR